MDPYELQKRQRLAEEATEKVMRDVPRIRVERVISDSDYARPTSLTRNVRPNGEGDLGRWRQQGRRG